ncbi:hypothetical protein [Rhodopseudomonas sp.]|uniref:hypothetical protein n=1 Tax=Rhodopseudomonas sp. TaxID=1078 RepID=UPI003B3B0D76
MPIFLFASSLPAMICEQFQRGLAEAAAGLLADSTKVAAVGSKSKHLFVSGGYAEAII